MKREEMVVQVMLKPNCGLENTRASLVTRRIAPFCDTVSCHPKDVKSNPSTVAFLRDHGLFLRFRSSTPEQVLLAIKSAFFVDSCTIVEDPDAIPIYRASDGAEADAAGSGSALPSLSRIAGELDARNEELVRLLARFEEAHRALRSHAEGAPHDRALNALAFSHAQAVDELRTAVARSRIEPFNRVASSLRALVAGYSRRVGVLADLDVADEHLALDRSVLASMEEIVRYVVRSCLREAIERPEERVAAGKPPRASLRLRLESDGSEVTCLVEHDGRPFDPRSVGRQALKRGLLARPLDTYTEEEIGALLFLPGFTAHDSGEIPNSLCQLNEVGSLLQHAGGRGTVRNLGNGAVEIALHFPVPFTVMEAALVRVGGTRFALPAQHIERFEAYSAQNMEPEGGKGGATARRPARYVGSDGHRYKLLATSSSTSPFKAEDPAMALILAASGKRCALVVDAVDGYERITVNRLPALLDRRTMREAGCFGYALLEDGTACAVASVRRLLDAAWGEGARRA